MQKLHELASPSSQKKFDRCRLLGQLQYIEHWEPREAERSLPARLRGTAFSKAAELVHKAIMNGDVEQLSNSSFITTIVDEAIGLFDRQFTYCIEKGIVFAPNTDSLSRAELRRVIPLYANYTPVRQWQKITAVEKPNRLYHTRPDLEGLNSLGFECVGDVKYKTSLESYYESNTIEEFHWDPQFLQYNHARRHDEGVPADVPVYSILILVVGSAFRIKPIEWLYTPEQLQLWYESALDMTGVVQGIRDGLVLPRAATTHKDNFGWCPMKKACLELNLDPELMKQYYVQLDKLPE